MSRRNRLTFSALTALAACALAGCSSASKHPAASGGSRTSGPGATSVSSPGSAGTNSTASSGAPAVDNASSTGGNVCSLLSAARASSINSVTYGATKSQTLTSGYDTCTYHNTGKHSSPIDIQDLTVAVLTIPGCWSQLQQADGPGTNIGGVGDAAFGKEIGIDVKAGDKCVTISGLTDAELQGRYGPDIAMAKIVIGALH